MYAQMLSGYIIENTLQIVSTTENSGRMRLKRYAYRCARRNRWNGSVFSLKTHRTDPQSVKMITVQNSVCLVFPHKPKHRKNTRLHSDHLGASKFSQKAHASLTRTPQALRSHKKSTCESHSAHWHGSHQLWSADWMLQAGKIKLFARLQHTAKTVKRYII